MEKSKFFSLFLLSFTILGCNSNNFKTPINTYFSTYEKIENDLNEYPLPTINSNILNIQIDEEYTYQSQEFFNTNLFLLFNHYFIYDTLYYDFMFPYSQENDYYFKNINDNSFKRSFFVQIPNRNLDIDGAIISYDMDEALSICESKEFVKEVHKGFPALA